MGYTYTHDITALKGSISHYDVVRASDYNETRATLLTELINRMTGSIRALAVYTNAGTVSGGEVDKCNDRSQRTIFNTVNMGSAVPVWAAFNMGIPLRMTELRLLPHCGYRYPELLWNGFTIWVSNNSTNGSDGSWAPVGDTYWRADNNFRWHVFPIDPGAEYQWYKINGAAQFRYSGGYYITCSAVEWATSLIHPLPAQRVAYNKALESDMDDMMLATKGLVNYHGSPSFPWTNPTFEQWETILAIHLEEVRQVIDDSLHGSRCYFDCTAACGSGCSAACTTGCGAGCAATCADSGCTNTCSSGCTTSCTAGCSLGCANTCSVNCQSACDTTCYAGCSGVCKTTCSGDCRGDYSCVTDCQNYCRGGCGSRCGASCSGSCAEACMWGCLNTCTGACGSDCSGGCGSSCHMTCGNNTCSNNCGMACSFHACSANCTSSCLFNCYTSCSSGCGTDCTTTARIGNAPGL